MVIGWRRWFISGGVWEGFYVRFVGWIVGKMIFCVGCSVAMLFIGIVLMNG